MGQQVDFLEQVKFDPMKIYFSHNQTQTHHFVMGLTLVELKFQKSDPKPSDLTMDKFFD